jgi:hypothetical protein
MIFIGYPLNGYRILREKYAGKSRDLKFFDENKQKNTKNAPEH